jgi:regulator of vacuolar morphogenesis
MPPLDITIPKSSTSTGPGKPYTVYHITMHKPSSLRADIVQKRYSDFAALHAALHQQSGGAEPPEPLPGKSWFSRTVNNEALTDERRRGLERYLRAIEGAADGRWRETEAWRSFLGLGEKEGGGGGSGGRSGSVSGSGREGITTAGDWLEAHGELKTRLQEARLFLAKREQAQAATAQHEAGAGAKKCLVQASQLIAALEEGLARLGVKDGGGESAGWGSEQLGEGELRRRRDLLSTARKEREGLEDVLNAMALRSAKASAASSAVGGPGAATQEAKANLFQGANTLSSSLPSSSKGRVLGGPAKETERTRELDNEGVLQLQRQIIAEQDQDLGIFTKAVRRMREMGEQIRDEVTDQNVLLGMFGEDVDRQVCSLLSCVGSPLTLLL